MLVAIGGACSHGSSGAKPAASSPPTVSQSQSAARVTRILRIGSVNVQHAGSKATVSAAVRRAVLATAQRYLNNAVLAPLETGKLGAGYAGTFSGAIQAAALGPDRAALTELQVGKTTTLSEQATPVAFSALVDGSGALLYAATRFTVTIHATRATGAITIVRVVELTMEPVASGFPVVAYRTSVKRSTPKPVSTTTAPRATRPLRTTTTVRTRGSTRAP